MAATAQRYSAVAIVLHWAIAFAIAFMIPLGWWMHEALENPNTIVAATAGFQLHKSIGLTILVLSLIRLGWRLANPPPPFPAAMPVGEKAAALAVHWAFYVAIIAMPLSGWLYVSAGWSAHENHPLVVSTRWFGLFTVPHLFDIVHKSDDVRRTTAGITGAIHARMAWAIIVLSALHVAAALKHQFFNRDEVLSHMVPGMKAPNEAAPPPKSAGRNVVLGAGFALIGVAAAAAIYAVLNLNPMAAPPAQAETTTVTQASTETASGTATATTQATSATTQTSTSTAGPPPAWTVNQAASSIRFGATYTDDDSGPAPFTGRFDHWRAVIHFDPNDLAHSSAVVTIEMNSVHDFGATGLEITDHRTYLQAEPWFDWARHPTAEFRTSAITHVSGDRYEARGALQIKGRSIPMTLPFTLTLTGAHAVMEGHAHLTRAAGDIGVRDENGNSHVEPGVDINVHVDATRG